MKNRSYSISANPNENPKSEGKANSRLSQFSQFKHEERSEIAKNETSRLSYFQLFRYSTVTERILIFLSIALASIGSIGAPFSIVIYGEFIDLLIDRRLASGTSSRAYIIELFGGGKVLTNASREENQQAIRDDSTAYGIASLTGAIIEFILLAIAVNIINRIALRQISRIRKMFFKSILSQDMSWFDFSSNNSFSSQMAEELDKLKEGIGEKLVIVTFLMMTFVAGVITSFLYGWKLALVVMICCPFVIISTTIVARVQNSLAAKEMAAYSEAGCLVEEVISGIRTVAAYNGEDKECTKYNALLVPAEKTGLKKGLYSGLGSGVMWLVNYCCYAIAMWYGVVLILGDRYAEVRSYTPGVINNVLFTVIMGAQNVGFSSPHVDALSKAKAAAQPIFDIGNRKSAIDPMRSYGTMSDTMNGNLSFENLHFEYPARNDCPILKGFTLEVKAGETVALVGPSGCGKSTVLQLVQRFYDPRSGLVKVDGNDIRDINIGWLRSHIGVVGQEPVLFATTIGENIRYGARGATQVDIENAARAAHCHDFICKLPNGYNTLVGERGAQISGGQKQRIAIARALIRNPKILLLDEPTSALDSASERHVQDALDAASQGRTTLVVSHRLSTIFSADKIVFVKNGVVAEQGTHKQLMNKRGLYYTLVNISQGKDSDDGAKTIDAEEYDEQSDEEIASVDSYDKNEKPNRKHRLSSVKNTDILKENLEDIQEEAENEEQSVSILEIMKLNASEWRYILFGCIAAMLHGATFPVWSVFFGEFFGVLSSDNEDYIRSETKTIAYIFIGIGFFAGLGMFLQTLMFNTAGVKMTTRLRQRAFKTIVTEDIQYFDDQNNSVGALCARLAGDCSNVQGATGARVGIIVQALSTLVIGVIIAFIFSWNLTLVSLIMVPLICLSIWFEARFTEKSARAEMKAIETSSKIASEAIANIRTVASLGLEEFIWEQYCNQVDQAKAECQKKVSLRGIIFGMGQVAPLFGYSISLCYGGMLVANEEIAYETIIKVSEALIFGSWMVGQALSYAPNVNAAVLAAERLLNLFNRSPGVHNPKSSPFNTIEKIQGNVRFSNVNFHYPLRKQVQILKNLSLTIKSGTTVALVGPSGSGKSTCVLLLLRFYDPSSGEIDLDGVPSTEICKHTLRTKLGLVSQEPILFDRTIADNIAYGDNSRDNIMVAEIIEAAKKSNIHEFITSLPQGYQTRLGNRGTQLSGGQKQRIAIARSLIRNPTILILDEATSALDVESEKIVQEALNTAREGRTCITVAHRLSTIRDASLICVLKAGELIESGTHDELIKLRGNYYNLLQMQEIS